MTDRIPPATAPSPQPSALRRVGEGCLWLILIGLVVYFGLRLASILLVVVLPTLLALVLAALLVAPVRWLRHHRVPPAAATLAVLVGVLVAIGALAAWIFPRVGGQLGELSAGLTDGLDEVERWLAEGPLGLSHEQVNTAFDRVEQLVRDNVGSLAQLGLTGATILLQLLAGLLLAVIVLFFFLKDGERLWNGLLGFVPGRHRAGIRVGGEGGWSGLGSFLRAQTLVALFDAVFIGLALVIVGVPLALPLTVITFLAAYVPYLGAISAGAAAVLIALVAQGFTSALIVLAAILLVQQLEGNVIEPIVMGRALQVHPLVILLGVVIGGVLGGIVGSIIAAPVLAALTGIINAMRDAGDGDGSVEGSPPTRAAVGAHAAS